MTTSDLDLLLICPFKVSIYHYILFKIINENENSSFKGNTPIRNHVTIFDLMNRRKNSSCLLLIVLSIEIFKIKDKTCILPLCSV